MKELFSGIQHSAAARTNSDQGLLDQPLRRRPRANYLEFRQRVGMKAGFDWALIDGHRLARDSFARDRAGRFARRAVRYDSRRCPRSSCFPLRALRTGPSPTTQSGASFSGGNPDLAPGKGRHRGPPASCSAPTFFDASRPRSTGTRSTSAMRSISRNGPARSSMPRSARSAVSAAARRRTTAINIVEVDRFFIQLRRSSSSGRGLRGELSQERRALRRQSRKSGAAPVRDGSAQEHDAHPVRLHTTNGQGRRARRSPPWLNISTPPTSTTTGRSRRSSPRAVTSRAAFSITT